MDWKVTTAPSIEPVTKAEAKLHLKVEVATDDDLIDSLIKTSRDYCEQFQNRAYIEQVITAKMDSFCNVIHLPKSPLISVTSIQYIDSNGETQTLDSSYYDVDTTSEPGNVTLAYGKNYPATRNVHHAVVIVYKAGYGEAAANVPERIKQAMKLLIGHFYENREAILVGTIAKELPMSVKSLLSLDRIF